MSLFLWVLLLLLGILLLPGAVIGVLAVIAFFRADDYDLAIQRIRSGMCARCGYDLRASKDRCPECAEPMPALPAAPPV